MYFIRTSSWAAICIVLHIETVLQSEIRHPDKKYLNLAGQYYAYYLLDDAGSQGISGMAMTSFLRIHNTEHGMVNYHSNKLYHLTNKIYILFMKK